MSEQTEEKTNNEKEVSSGGISIKSYLFACLRNWYWFILSVIITGCLAFLYAKSRPQLYSASSLVLIKTDLKESGGGENVIADLSSSRRYRSLTNEIYVIKSLDIMKDVVSKLNLNVSYFYHKYLRDVAIFNESPVLVTPVKEVTSPFSLEVRTTGPGTADFRFAGSKDGHWKRTKFGSTINTDFGPIRFDKNPNSDDSYINEVFTVHVTTVNSRARQLIGGLNIIKDQKDANVLRLTMTTNNAQLSTSALNALVAAYNQFTIDDKNRAARNTEAFIVDRIDALSKDLGGIDSQIEHIKQINRYPTIETAAQVYTQRSTTSTDQLTSVEMELSLVEYVKNYINSAGPYDLIPANAGINDQSINGLIERYNTACLNYQHLASTSGDQNPALVDIKKQVTAMRQSLTHTVDNYINTLRIKKNQMMASERSANSMMMTVPTQEKAINDITRQQKIKEQLYLFLLNKREENALQVAITEPNARVLEPATGG